MSASILTCCGDNKTILDTEHKRTKRAEKRTLTGAQRGLS